LITPLEQKTSTLQHKIAKLHYIKNYKNYNMTKKDFKTKKNASVIWFFNVVKIRIKNHAPKK